MKRFAELQDAFQRAILAGDDAVLADLLDGANERRAALFDVYRNAYVMRLVEAMGKEHPALRAFLGDETFDEMASAYVAARPSRHPNIRWISDGLPSFLAAEEPYSDHIVVNELACIEKALNDAFDAPDAVTLTAEDLGSLPQETWPELLFEPHPSARRLTLSTNATAIWSALSQDETPPDVASPTAPVELLVWRHDGTSMLRELSAEEAMMWDETAAAIPFGQICVMLATFDDPDNAPGRAAGYLSGWIQAQLLATARVAELEDEVGSGLDGGTSKRV